MKPLSAVLCLLVSLCWSSSLRAGPERSWLNLCADTAPPAAEMRREYLGIDGSRRWLSLSQRPDASCESIELPGADVNKARLVFLQWAQRLRSWLDNVREIPPLPAEAAADAG